MKLTKADLKVLGQAVELAAHRWREDSLNYGVMGRATEGAWYVEAATARRKHRALERRLVALAKAAEKLGV